MGLFIGASPIQPGDLYSGSSPVKEVWVGGSKVWESLANINVSGALSQFTQTYLDAVGWTQRRGAYTFAGVVNNLDENAFGYVTPQTTRAYINYNSDGTNTNTGQLVQQGLALTDGASYTFRVYRQSSGGSGTKTMLIYAVDGNDDNIGGTAITANGWAELVFTPTPGALTTQLYIAMGNTFGVWPASINVSEIQFYENP